MENDYNAAPGIFYKGAEYVEVKYAIQSSTAPGVPRYDHHVRLDAARLHNERNPESWFHHVPHSFAQNTPWQTARSGALYGGLFGAGLGALMPGEDEDGKDRGMLMGALRGGAMGTVAGGMAGYGAGRATHSYLGDTIADVRGQEGGNSTSSGFNAGYHTANNLVNKPIQKVKDLAEGAGKAMDAVNTMGQNVSDGIDSGLGVNKNKPHATFK